MDDLQPKWRLGQAMACGHMWSGCMSDTWLPLYRGVRGRQRAIATRSTPERVGRPGVDDPVGGHPPRPRRAVAEEVQLAGCARVGTMLNTQPMSRAVGATGASVAPAFRTGVDFTAVLCSRQAVNTPLHRTSILADATIAGDRRPVQGPARRCDRWPRRAPSVASSLLNPSTVWECTLATTMSRRSSISGLGPSPVFEDVDLIPVRMRSGANFSRSFPS